MPPNFILKASQDQGCCENCKGQTSWQDQEKTEKTNETLIEFSKCSLFDELTFEPPLGQLVNLNFLYDLISSSHLDIDDILSKLEKRRNYRR